MENMRVRNMMHEKQQVIRASRQRLIELSCFGRVLPDVSRPGGHSAVHTDALIVSTDPLTPAVALSGLNVGTIVAAQNISERPHAERPGVPFVDAPRFQLHFYDG